MFTDYRKTILLSLPAFVLCGNVCLSAEDAVSALPKDKLMQQSEYRQEVEKTHFKTFLDVLENNDLCNAQSSIYYYETCKAKVVFVGKYILSYRLETQNCYGGCHEPKSIYTGTFWLSNTGEKHKRMKLEDIVTEQELPRMQELILEAFKKKLIQQKIVFRIEADGTVNTGYPLPKPTENFYYDAKGLHFFYNEGDIHCYNAGSFDLCIQWKKPYCE